MNIALLAGAPIHGTALVYIERKPSLIRSFFMAAAKRQLSN
jgi:hypothetical protein